MNMSKEEIEARERLEEEAVAWIEGNPSVTRDGCVVKLFNDEAHKEWMLDFRKRLESHPIATKESLVGIYLEWKARQPVIDRTH